MSWLRWVLIAIAVAKGLDSRYLETGFCLVWLAVAAAMLVLPHRVGYALLAVFCFGGAALELERMTHDAVLVGWVAAVLALWGDEASRVRLLRVQTVVLYLFAAVAKMNPRWLAGDVIAERRDLFLFPQAMAVAVIFVEIALGVLVWRQSRWALPAAVAVHVSIFVGWTTNFVDHGPGLLIFNVLTVALVAASLSRGGGASVAPEEARGRVDILRPGFALEDPQLHVVARR